MGSGFRDLNGVGPIDGRGQGLGYEDEIIRIFWDHLNEALKRLGK
jgi:hypothetical protein